MYFISVFDVNGVLEYELYVDNLEKVLMCDSDLQEGYRVQICYKSVAKRRAEEFPEGSK